MKDVTEEWAKNYDAISDIQTSIYNSKLGQDINYTPRGYIVIDTDCIEKASDDVDLEKPLFTIPSRTNPYDKKSSVLFEANRTGKLPKGRVLNLSFETNNFNKLRAALIDVKTAEGIRQVQGAFDSPGFNKLFPNRDSRNLIKKRIARYVDLKRGNKSTTESEQKTLDTYSDDYKPLCKVMSEILNHGVEKVIVSDRLVYAPCVLVAGQKGLSANMERILKAQAIRNPVSRETILSKRIMELNPKHPMVKSLNNLCHTLDMGQVLNERTEKLEKEKEMKKEGVDESIDTSKENDNENEEVIAKNMEIKRFEDITWLLYDMALIDSGFSLEQPRHFTSRIQNILSSVMGYNMTPSFFEEGSESKKENMKTSKSMETTKQMETIQEDNENVDVELDTDNLQNIELEVN